MTPLPITCHTAVCALGAGRDALLAGLRDGRSGLSQQPFETATMPAWIGHAPDLERQAMPGHLQDWDCRNNRLAMATLQADGFDARVRGAASRWGAHRVGVFLGTSTSAILQTEIAYRERDAATGALPDWLVFDKTHDTASLARFVRLALDLRGPAFTLSTACSSSAKAFATAARMIDLGLIDAAVVGGVDSLCLTTLYGFHALELLSPEVCRPWDARRNGLSLGEAGAMALLERHSDAPMGWLRGCGESSDGHHMSAPHPEGAGAVLAMRQALAAAGLEPQAVDYLNAHGTGTANNDAAEDLAIRAVFGTSVPVSSTKGYTGHTLGAAGGLEAVVSLLALQHGLMPAGLHCEQPDPGLQADYRTRTVAAPLGVVASNSFGFGGSNACLLFGAA